MTIDSLSAIEPGLTSMFRTVVEEFLVVASKSERYREAWRHLTPYVAIDFVSRRRPDVNWLGHVNRDECVAGLARCLDVMWPAVIRLQCVVDEAKTLDSVRDIHSRYDAWLRSPIPVIERFCDPFSLAVIRETYELMLRRALGARLAKLSELPRGKRVFRTRKSSPAIEQIRASAYSRETAFIFDADRLPVGLPCGVSGPRCLAVTMPDEWIARCDSFVDFSAPSFGLVDSPQSAQQCVLQLASGWVRLDALEVHRFLRQFDDELPLVFVGKETCALADHDFLALVDCASFDAILANFGELDALIPLLGERQNLGDGTLMRVDVKSRVLNAVSHAGKCCDRDLSDIPDAVDEMPF